MRWAVLAGAAMLVVACARNTTVEPPDEQKTDAGELPDDHPKVGQIVSRQTGRLSLLQLRGSFPAVMGADKNGRPITWNSGTSSSPKDGFDAYASTLGEADFVDRTEDDRDPSPIYVKFMDDAARSACDQALTADRAQANQAERTLMRYVSRDDTPDAAPEAFRRNLAYLKLRFHGIKVTDDAQVEPLVKLFTSAGRKSSNPVEDGWRAVCVALLTAPEFHLY